MKTPKLWAFRFMLLMVCSILACQSKTDKKQANSSPELSTELNETYVSGLYEYYIPNAQDREHIEENAIIEFIIGGNIEYTRSTSGYYYAITKPGSGENYAYGQDCRADYRGYFLDGKEFDSSYKRGIPLDFKVGQMIYAWNDLLQKVNPGTHAKLIVPSRLAYGKDGFPGFVPPNTITAFDIETIDTIN